MLTSSTETERGSGYGGDDTDIGNQETDGAEGGVEVELANLEDTARARLFALYGIHRRSLLPDEDPPCFVGWGMEFPRLQKAVLWLARRHLALIVGGEPAGADDQVRRHPAAVAGLP